MNRDSLIILIAVIITVIGLAIYSLVIFVCFLSDSWLFAPYIATVPTGACQPLISLIPLTPDQIEQKQANLASAATYAPNPIPS